MAEPERKYTPDIEAKIRPNLGVINGGGESTSARGNLSSVDSERVNQARDRERNLQAINGGGESTSARGNLSSVDSLRDDEAGFVSNVTGNQNTNKSRFSVKGILGNKKWLASAGVTGVAGLAIAAFMALIPLKLEMFISNITQAASAVPGHAIEERTEHLITRALATRLLMKANGGMSTDDGKVAFCGGGGIACSLWLTYSSDYFEKKLGITFEADGRNRAKLGGKAQSWDIKASGSDGQNIDGIVQRITSHSEMRAFLKTEVKKNNNKNIVTRYIGRKILMKKYGVRNFNGPKKLEDTRNSYNNAKTRLKANVIANTAGKVSPRLATYLTCIQGGATCAEVLRKSFTAGGVDLNQDAPDESASEEEKERYAQAQAANDAVRSAELGEIPTEGSGGAVKKFMSNKIVQIVGGSVAGVGMLDLIFGAIGAIDKGALEEVWYDIASQSYVGFAYEDLVVANEKMKAGDIDMASLQVATELMDGAEQSTLQQAENGALSGAAISAGVTRKCDTGKDEEKGGELTTLEPGELVCPDRKAVRHYKMGFRNQSWWGALTTAATGWNKSVGTIFDFVGEALGTILSKVPGFDQVAALLGKALEPAMEWIIGMLFTPPSLGFDDAGKAMGASNYDALSGGIRIAQNDTMLEGVDADGTAGGGGGRLLSDPEVSSITNQYIQEEQEVIAKNGNTPAFLNPYVKGSLTQQIALIAPTSTSSFTTLPSRLLGSILPKTTSVAAATTVTANPFGLPISGYTASDGVFDANPEKYTEEECVVSAQAREDSFSHDKDVGISVYTKSDPCALEKMVVGAELVGNGVYDDKYSLKDPLPLASSGNGLNVMTYNITSSVAKGNAEERSVYAVKNMVGMDLIGLQEASSEGSQNQVKMIKSGLSGYDSETVATRTIFWNASKFKLIKSDSFDIPKENTPDGGNPMIWMQLESISTGKKIYAISIHPDVDSPSNRKRAGEIVVKLIKDKLNDGSPVIIMGDMNGGDQFATNPSGRATGRDVNKVFLESGILTYTYEAALAKTHAEYKSFNGFGKLKREKDGEAVHLDQIYISNSANATVNTWENIINENTSKASDHNPIKVNLSIPGLTLDNEAAGGSASVNADGYAFPVDLNGLTDGIKLNQTKTMHHSNYDAFDLMSKDNTTVYAITDGEIVKVKRSYTFGSNKPGKPCESLTFKGKDGYYYWYGHIIGSTTKTTDIKAGEPIAKVAGKSYGPLCHGGGPHLHIDRNKSLTLAGRQGDPSFIPLLSKIYEAAGGK